MTEERKVVNMKINEDMKETVRYVLGLGDEEEATKILKGLDLSDANISSVIDEVEPMTIEEAVKYMNSD